MAKAPEYLHGGKNLPEQITDELLRCVICEDTFREPKLLPCGHIFCLQCLQAWFNTCANGLRRLPEPYLPPYNDKKGRQAIDNPCPECGIERIGVNIAHPRCPRCNVEICLPDGGLHALPNYMFGNTQIDFLLRRANKIKMIDVINDEPHRYVISDYCHYGDTQTASMTLKPPHWHGWGLPK